MFKKLSLIAISSFLLVACSDQQPQLSKPTLGELEKVKVVEANASVSTNVVQMANQKDIPTSAEQSSYDEKKSKDIVSLEKKKENQAVKEAVNNNTGDEASIQQKKERESKQRGSEQNNQPKPVPQHVSAKGNIKNLISWNDFFDNDLQNTPSEKLWDLQGQQVVIDGFMGEVLSLDGGWFLLIPAPGAECPFDNGDQSYWNKIMIVFVEDKKDLRFTHGPLRITGRLDVGIKVDESNYKTMFRLYDATFEKVGK